MIIGPAFTLCTLVHRQVDLDTIIASIINIYKLFDKISKDIAITSSLVNVVLNLITTQKQHLLAIFPTPVAASI
jgi:chemotaxis protein CheY-P-specific phosphatase CheC